MFANISASEDHHMSAIANLIDRYELENPAAALSGAEFNNPDLGYLYDSLVVDGSASLAAAFYVGATIEDLDIADLTE